MSQDAISMDALSVSDGAIRIPLHHLRVPPNVPAGLSPWTLMAIAHEIRCTGLDVREPILVRCLGPDDWRIVDGRHRFCASIMAGVRDILAVEVP